MHAKLITARFSWKGYFYMAPYTSNIFFIMLTKQLSFFNDFLRVKLPKNAKVHQSGSQFTVLFRYFSNPIGRQMNSTQQEFEISQSKFLINSAWG